MLYILFFVRNHQNDLGFLCHGAAHCWLKTVIKNNSFRTSQWLQQERKFLSPTPPPPPAATLPEWMGGCRMPPEIALMGKMWNTKLKWKQFKVQVQMSPTGGKQCQKLFLGSIFWRSRRKKTFLERVNDRNRDRKNIRIFVKNSQKLSFSWSATQCK